MRTRSLIGTHDGIFGEQVPTHRSFKDMQQLSFCFAPKDKLGPINACRLSLTTFGEQDISIRSLTITPKISLLETSAKICSDSGFYRTFALKRGKFAASDDSDEWDEDDEFDKELARYRGLVLDVTYRPINVVCWRRALCLEVLEKADVLEYYDQVINSPSRRFAIPAVLRVTDYVHTPVRSKIKLSLNRRNIFLRDKFRCQYCNAQDNLTVDHVVPASQGGSWTWQNLVTACSKCNLRKGNKTLEAANMQLIKMPNEPNALDGRDMPSNYATYRTLNNSRSMPSKWIDYLPERLRHSRRN